MIEQRQLLRRMMVAALCLGAATSTVAADAPPQPVKRKIIDSPILDVENKSRACWSLLEQDAEEAFRFAQGWAGAGGDVAAHRCAAQALMLLGRSGEAARVLEGVAVALADRSVEAQVMALRDAGRAWLVAGDARRAVSSFDHALSQQNAVTGDIAASLVLDRAVAKAALGDYRAALDDLDIVTRKIGDDREVVLVRARIYRRLGWTDMALDDLNAYLKRVDFDGDALVERGLLRQQRKDISGAVADWRIAARLSPGSPAGAEAARLAAAALPPPAPPAPRTQDR